MVKRETGYYDIYCNKLDDVFMMIRTTVEYCGEDRITKRMICSLDENVNEGNDAVLFSLEAETVVTRSLI